MQDAGVAEVAGIDGPWVDARRFAAGADRFVPFDFNNAAKHYAPPLPREKFDLVLTLEFLEHVEPAHAADLVAFMARTADIVVAGAAPPGQGGVNHVNEQWPSYWRALFAAHGFTAFDALRPLIWDLDDVEPWYIQNPVCYFKGEVPAAVRQRAERAAVAHLDDPASLVHPGTLRAKARQLAKRRGLIKRIFG